MNPFSTKWIRKKKKKMITFWKSSTIWRHALFFTLLLCICFVNFLVFFSKRQCQDDHLWKTQKSTFFLPSFCIWSCQKKAQKKKKKVVFLMFFSQKQTFMLLNMTLLSVIFHFVTETSIRRMIQNLFLSKKHTFWCCI